MKVSQLIFKNSKWKNISKEENKKPKLIIIFGNGKYFINKAYKDIREKYPKAEIIGCSTAGTIANNKVKDNIVANLITFKKTEFKVIHRDYDKAEESKRIGISMGNDFKREGLKHIFILSEGLNINGSELIKGFNDNLPEEVKVTGGLAGDKYDFENTYVIANDNPKQNRVMAIGFYGENIEIETGCKSGWDEFGAERTITKSKGNIIYEIDGKPALDLYKLYLGEEAKDLPASGLKFPISIKSNKKESSEIIRTLLSVNEDENSLIFAGDVPEDYVCRLMKSNLNKLINYAGKSAKEAKTEGGNNLCIAISCVGRRLVLSQLIEEEIESIKKEISKKDVITGFYSYGEISPINDKGKSELHNQTMTITMIREKD